MVSVWFEGIEDLMKVEADLGVAGARIGAQGAAIVRRTALAIEGTGKELVHVDTGATKNSIGTDFAGDGRSGVIESETGPTTDWAPHLEYGTSRMGPFPFMGPAFDRHAPTFLAAVEALSDPLP